MSLVLNNWAQWFRMHFYFEISRADCSFRNSNSFLFNYTTYLYSSRITDEFRFCCAARISGRCTPEPDEFSSCTELMSNYVLRVSIWVLGLTAFWGNIVVIVWRTRDRRNGKVCFFTFCYCHARARRHYVFLESMRHYINVVSTSCASWLYALMGAASIVPAK